MIQVKLMKLLTNMDYKKILKGLLIAMLAAVLTYAEEIVPGLDFGTYTPIAVAINSALVNALRQYFKLF